jgi:hypothetical protein
MFSYQPVNVSALPGQAGFIALNVLICSYPTTGAPLNANAVTGTRQSILYIYGSP